MLNLGSTGLLDTGHFASLPRALSSARLKALPVNKNNHCNHDERWVPLHDSGSFDNCHYSILKQAIDGFRYINRLKSPLTTGGNHLAFLIDNVCRRKCIDMKCFDGF